MSVNVWNTEKVVELAGRGLKLQCHLFMSHVMLKYLLRHGLGLLHVIEDFIADELTRVLRTSWSDSPCLVVS